MSLTSLEHKMAQLPWHAFVPLCSISRELESMSFDEDLLPESVLIAVTSTRLGKTEMYNLYLDMQYLSHRRTAEHAATSGRTSEITATCLITYWSQFAKIVS